MVHWRETLSSSSEWVSMDQQICEEREVGKRFSLVSERQTPPLSLVYAHIRMNLMHVQEFQRSEEWEASSHTQRFLNCPVRASNAISGGRWYRVVLVVAAYSLIWKWAAPLAHQEIAMRHAVHSREDSTMLCLWIMDLLDYSHNNRIYIRSSSWPHTAQSTHGIISRDVCRTLLAINKSIILRLNIFILRGRLVCVRWHTSSLAPLFMPFHY